MPINVKTPVAESREQRLGTIIAWEGKASALAKESDYARGCGAGRKSGIAPAVTRAEDRNPA